MLKTDNIDFDNPRHIELVKLLLYKLANIYYPAMSLMLGEKSHHLQVLERQLKELGIFNLDFEEEQC